MVGRSTATAGSQRPWLLAFALFTFIAATASVLPQAARAQTDTPEICPPGDPGACLIRCHYHKRECLQACTERKSECLSGVRAELQSCKLECRANSDDAEALGFCKRRCVAHAIETAKTECKAGRPVCVHECNPLGCRRACGLSPEPTDGAPSDGTGDPATLEEPAPTDAPADGGGTVDQCVPPPDRECLGQCARALEQCAKRVRAATGECLQGCRGLTGDDLRLCVRDCATTAREQGKTCKDDFRLCTDACWPTSDVQ